MVQAVVPGRTVAGDTVRVLGDRFGADRGAGKVIFAFPGGEMEAEVASWSDAEILALVPGGPPDVPATVTVRKAGEEAEGRAFEVAAEAVYYETEVEPLFVNYGCTGCHPGQGRNLHLTPSAALLSGESQNGPVVKLRRSVDSLLLQVLEGPTSVTERMPRGGPFLNESEILLVADWIDQGARERPAPPSPEGKIVRRFLNGSR